MKTLTSITSKSDFIALIQSLQENFTPTHRKLATYLIQNFTEVAFMKAQQWAQKVQTTEVSVIRFVRVLGFKGFSEFSEKLQQIIRQEMTMTDYVEVSIKNRPKEMNLLLEAIQFEKQNLNELIQKYKPENMAEIVDKVFEAQRVVIVGTRSSAPLAEYCDYMFIRALGKEAILLKDCGYQTFDCLIPLLNKKPLVIAFAYPRYPDKTIEIVEFLKSHGATIIGITNHELSPLVPLSDHVLYAPSYSLAFTDSFSGATVLINTLIMEIVSKYPELTQTVIPQFEKIAKEKGYYRFK